MKKLLGIIAVVCFTTSLLAQHKSSLPAQQWVDSVFSSLSDEQRIAQLIIIRAHSNLGQQHVSDVINLVSKYNVGGLCFFQGGPVRQANLTNYYQSIAKTPLLVSIDGEWGLGMRLDSVINFPRQLMIGAVPDGELVYQFGRAVGEQCKRMGIQINFAPDVDVNNNPENPVINDRSFGEDKYRVALFGTQYMKGMQDVGVLACAKHFPGHGDVSVDSHLDLPVINKGMSQLDTLELYPFKKIVNAGVGSVMTAHLAIPAIDNTPNQPTSLSFKNVTSLLKEKLEFDGLAITDGLEMKGVTKYYAGGEVSVRSLAAGNDMLLLPADVADAITKITEAIKEGKLNRDDLNQRVKKILMAKYKLGLNQLTPIETEGLVEDINNKTKAISQSLALNAITLLKGNAVAISGSKNKVAYVAVGVDSSNVMIRAMKSMRRTDVFPLSYKADTSAIASLLTQLQQYDKVVMGVHNYSRRPANNYGMSKAAVEFINRVQSQLPTTTVVFGNPYAIVNFSSTATNLIACYEDDSITQLTALRVLKGDVLPKGKLPVTVSTDLRYATGITPKVALPFSTQAAVGLNVDALSSIDSIANNAIASHAAPGCVVLVAKDGNIVFNKAYGYMNYDSLEPVTTETIYDLASVTKISATTMAVMKLYEEKKLKLTKTLGDYLPWLKGTDKAPLLIKDVLLHQAGLNAFIPFYRETLDTAGNPLPSIYSRKPTDSFSVRVAENVYIRNDWQDTLKKRILVSKLGERNKYVYSDNDFILLGKIVESISGMSLDNYVKENFYEPLMMYSTRFKPNDHFALNFIAPTEQEKKFRKQLLRGDVHDPGASMFGGVAGHAGLFSNAYDLAILYEMLLNRGELNGRRYFKKKTINLFTSYNSTISRRGLGFDKPEKDNATRKDPYPTLSASPQTFGHTGYTGTCVWADPAHSLLYIFLSNRVTPEGGDNTRLLKMNVRSNIHEAIYKAISAGTKPTRVSN
jgi:beta-N-acetylhexosaminidase